MSNKKNFTLEQLNLLLDNSITIKTNELICLSMGDQLTSVQATRIATEISVAGKFKTVLNNTTDIQRIKNLFEVVTTGEEGAQEEEGMQEEDTIM